MTNNISNNSGITPRVMPRVQRRNALNLLNNNRNTLPTNNHNVSWTSQDILRIQRQRQRQQQLLLLQQQERLERPDSPTSITEL